MADETKYNNDIDMSDLFGQDLPQENDSVTDLAEQVLRASEEGFSSSTFASQFSFNFGGFPPRTSSGGGSESSAATSAINWRHFVSLPSPDPRDCGGNGVNGFFDLKALCLTDNEKAHLHTAAQNYLQQQQQSQQQQNIPQSDEENSLIIKYCHGKYKEFNSVKKMNEAAVLIQSKFRSYKEQKRFQRSRHAAILIQSSYRNYKSTRRYLSNLSRSGLAKKQQHQAARKIQRFLRRCRHR